jgi:hypothetical protein
MEGLLKNQWKRPNNNIGKDEIGIKEIYIAYMVIDMRI